MKNILLIVLQFVLLITNGQARGKISRIKYSGQIKSDQDSIKLFAAWYPNYIMGTMQDAEYQLRYVTLDKAGKFKFSLPAIDRPGRILIAEYVTNTIICDYQLMEPGDSISIFADIKNGGENVDLQFSGKGSGKYNCGWALSQIPFDIYTRKQVEQKIQLADSISSIKFEIMERYKSKLSPLIYSILKADITGKINNDILFSQFGQIIDWGIVKNGDISDTNKSILNKISSRKQPVSNDVASLSKDYIPYLYNKLKVEMVLSNKTGSVNYVLFYNKIKQQYSGSLRDKLLSYFLLYDLDLTGVFSKVTDEEYTKCLKDGLTAVKTPWLKSYVNRQYNARAKGGKAFNFLLPADSSNKKIQLSDFKGKVILLDIWSYQCTGCYKFAQTFHAKIWPLFKTDSNFVVVSMMIDGSTKESYMRRLRAEGNVHYTFPDYINLFGGRDISMGREIEKAYNLSVYPTILLIGKNNKIFSSRVPTPLEHDDPNIERLIELIKEALKIS